jgi:hypothetical protein
MIHMKPEDSGTPDRAAGLSARFCQPIGLVSVTEIPKDIPVATVPCMAAIAMLRVNRQSNHGKFAVTLNSKVH